MIRKAFSQLGLRKKIGLVLTFQLALLGAATLWMFTDEYHTTAQADSVLQAKRLVDMAESVRHGVAEQWESGVYDQKVVAQWAADGDVDRVLSTVPIVSAWNSLMRRADEGGYQLRMPRFNARNSKNEPNELEAEVLRAFEKDSKLADYTAMDHENNTVRYFRPIRLTAQCLTCHGDPVTSKEIWGNEDGLDGLGYKMENLKEGDLHGAYEVIQSMDKADQRATAAISRGAFMIALFILLSICWLVYFLNKSLFNPLMKFGTAFDKVGSGDLRETLTVTSQDELGALQGGLNTMVQRLRTLIASMQNSSNNLNGVSSNLSHTAVRVENAVEETNHRSDSVASSAHEMTTNLSLMDESLQHVGETVQSVTAATVELQTSARTISESTEQSSQIARRAETLASAGGNEIGELEKAAVGIGQIVEVIQDIAEQTNLLALNATIEASRAGDAGKGFAVVAAEVKQLARQTSEATLEIRKRIESVQGTTGRVVQSIRDIKDIIGNVSQQSGKVSTEISEQQTTISEIATQMQDAAEATRAIILRVNETVKTAREVARSISEVSTYAGQTANEIHETKTAGVELNRVSSEFNDLLSGFAV